MELQEFKQRYAQLTDLRVPTQQVIADITGYKIDAVKSWTRLSAKTRNPVPEPAKQAMQLYIEKLESGKTATLAVLEAVRTGETPAMDSTLWDKGAAFFSHLDNSDYDGRDCFSTDGARKLVQRLVDLDSSEFVARAYVATLMKSAMSHVRFNVNQILNSRACEEWLAHYRDLHEHHNVACGDELAVFISKVRSHMASLSIDVPTDESAVSKLLVDALCATDMKVDWLYAYEGDPIPVKNYSSQLYKFPSMDVLEREVISGSLPYGVHLCGVTATGSYGRETVSNMIVCNTPNRAFVLSNMHYSFSQNSMNSESENRMTFEYWTSPTTHYPKWENEDQLPATKDSHPYAFGDISSMAASDALWVYMTMELAVLRCLTQEPTGRSVSLKLLEAVSDDSVRTTLPAIWTKPFDPMAPTIAQMLVAYEGHPNYKFMASLFDGIDDDVLLPDVELLGYDVCDRKAIPETYNHEQVKDINRYGNPATDLYSSKQRFTINLYPRPTAVFGNEAEVNKQLRKIASENFEKLLYAFMSADWADNAAEINKWFEGALRRRFDKVIAFEKKHADMWFFVPREGYNSNYPTQMANAPYLKYHPVRRADTDRENTDIMRLPMKSPRVGHFDGDSRNYKGFKSKRKAKREFFVNPMCAEDLMDMFDYKRSQLPKPLRYWKKTSLGGWGHHALLAWIFE